MPLSASGNSHHPLPSSLAHFIPSHPLSSLSPHPSHHFLTSSLPITSHHLTTLITFSPHPFPSPLITLTSPPSSLSHHLFTLSHHLLPSLNLTTSLSHLITLSSAPCTTTPLPTDAWKDEEAINLFTDASGDTGQWSIL